MKQKLSKLEIPDDWQKILKLESNKEYFKKLESFLSKEYQDKTIFPEANKIFEALRLCPLSKVKVVILGQDPYHGAGQAHGLAFSVQKNQNIPPSLKNIFKEIKLDLGVDTKDYKGELSSWTKQGVLLLNNVLTVEEAKAGSHQKKGWEEFTLEIIKKINEHKKNIVFILWGKPAEAKKKFIDGKKHLILTSAHPSPLSAYRGFFKQKHFSKTNDYLSEHGKKEIDWKLS